MKIIGLPSAGRTNPSLTSKELTLPTMPAIAEAQHTAKKQEMQLVRIMMKGLYMSGVNIAPSWSQRT